MKIALIGTAPGSRAVAPCDDPSWKIWGCSQGNQAILPRVDAWFELHALTYLMAPENRTWTIPYCAWLKSQTFPVYMQEKNDLVPGAIIFPIGKIIEQFGRNWLTSSIAMMMAYAISQMREGDEIGLFGVDMAAMQEHYTMQRAGLWRMIEICKDRGIKVSIPHESDLGQQPPIYGYCEATLMGRKLYHRLAELEQARAGLAQKRDQLHCEVAYFDGAIEQAKYFIRTFLDGADADVVLDQKPAEAAPKLETVKPVLTGDYKPSAGGVFMPPPSHVTGANGHAREE